MPPPPRSLLWSPRSPTTFPPPFVRLLSGRPFSCLLVRPGSAVRCPHAALTWLPCDSSHHTILVCTWHRASCLGSTHNMSMSGRPFSTDIRAEPLAQGLGPPVNSAGAAVCGVRGGPVRTDGLQDECVRGRGLPVQAHHRSHNGVTVADAELPVYVSSCGQERRQLRSGNRAPGSGKGGGTPPLLLSPDQEVVQE